MFSKGKLSLLKRIDIKLTAWYTTTFLIIILAVFGFLDYRLRHNLLKEIDRMLEDETHELVDMSLHHPADFPNRLKEYEETVANRKYYQIAFRVLDAEGNPLYRSSPIRKFMFPEIPPDQLAAGRDRSESIKPAERSSAFRLYTYYYKNGGEITHVIQIVTYLRMMNKTMQNFRSNLTIAFLISILFGSVGGWFLSRKTLTPIASITEATKRITSASLNERLPLHGTEDELDQLAETINKMIARLETSFKKLSQFTADAAHELRTPITALKGETEVLLSRNRTTQEYEESLTLNLERLDFLIKLMNDLLLLSQEDEGNSRLQIKAIPFTSLLAELCGAFSLVAEQKDITLTFSGEENVTVQGDRIRLQQLFTNLIDNAVKYTHRGGKIDLTVYRESSHIKAVLRDTGIGIPGADLPYVFDRFYRVDKSRDRDSGGAGLGLSICRWIVEAHQGSIDVESTPHQGTTVTVILPAALA